MIRLIPYRISILSLLAILPFAACDLPEEDLTADSGSTTKDAGGDDAATNPCDAYTDMGTFTTATTKAKTKFDDGYQVQRIFFTGFDDSTTYGSLSIIKIVAYQGLNGYPTGTSSSVDLSQIGQADGDGFLVKHGIDCDDRGRLCETWFWAYQGSASISAIDWSTPEGSTFSGDLSQVLFREVTIDADELPTPVANGCSFTLANFSWSGTVSLASGQD